MVRSAALALGSFVALTVAQMLYQGGDPSYRTIWAEDGRIHYQAVASHGLGALAMPYNGYLQVVSRLLAWPATWLPLGHLALYLAFAASATGALVALAVYRLSAGVIDSTVLRVALALAVALHPVLLRENLANITNIIWVLCFAVFWALIHRPENRGDVVLAGAVAFLGTVSNILAVCFFPVALYVAWTRRDRPDTGGARRVRIGGCGASHRVRHSLQPWSRRGRPPATCDALHRSGPRDYCVGDPGAATLWNDGGKAFLYPAALLVVGSVVVLIACNRGRTLRLGLIALGYSLVLFYATFIIRGTNGFQLGAVWNVNGSRYNVMGVLFVLAAIAIMIPHARMGELPRAVLSWALLAQIVIVIALGFHGSSGRSKGPEWYPALVAQAESCKVNPLGVRFVKTAPGIPWGIFFTCDQLRGIGA